MRDIPDFLKPENCKKNPFADKMTELEKEYKERFGTGITTESAPYGIEDWVEILQRCLDENIRVEQLLEGELETPDLEERDFIYISQ